MSTIDPNQTLYISNINGRVNKEELRLSLYQLFATYGPILDIVAKKTDKMREQAFVVYDNIASATTAKRSLNGFTFFGKPLKIEYAKTKSDAVAKLDGTYRLKIYKDKSGSDVVKRTMGDNADGYPAKAARTDDTDESDDDHA
ncbi:hypothetical protein BDF20DRAFT_866097 [Mycotypha africana]|uniref:uncharacterized protein n=1 Tax=Mycotypha africana TaxID=64632 RepID=UPI0022FFC4F0|nr:uncharacterized protein BDF20DRAFT_866097 [Mycotypha africana]KAI8982299.1 hypothetical protein BDF20DRAFT_866097 [Mycotypha africana]